jgi:D-beta-D-heptose 7-phosphate kinase/D-beta-D-heptose 1-phosphate adenosyltransferase
MQQLGLRIVLTSGSFDLLHIGHMRYLREARLRGDVLVVGVDSDAKVRERKGKYRPVIPERERAEMVVHSRYADVVTIKADGDEKWSLIKLVRPDVLVISERTGYDAETVDMLKQYCGEIVNLISQATASTSASVRQLQTETLRPVLDKLSAALDEARQVLGEDKA